MGEPAGLEPQSEYLHSKPVTSHSTWEANKKPSTMEREEHTDIRYTFILPKFTSHFGTTLGRKYGKDNNASLSKTYFYIRMKQL